MHVLMFPQLRKPTVEKIRRERINSSIEKLKSLLGQEFLKQQPDSRQEKADILEMTLDFLRLQQRSQNPSACSSTAARDGRSRCVQEAVNFLSQCPVQTESHRRLLKHFLHTQPYTENNTRVPPQISSPARRAAAKSKLWRSGDPGRSCSMWMWTTTINSVIREHVISDLPLSWENNCPVFLYLDLTVFLPLANYASS